MELIDDPKKIPETSGGGSINGNPVQTGTQAVKQAKPAILQSGEIAKKKSTHHINKSARSA